MAVSTHCDGSEGNVGGDSDGDDDDAYDELTSISCCGMAVTQG